MDEASLVRFERRGGVATVTLARPEQLNALSPPLMTELLATVERVAVSDARILILTGEGRAFSAGVDTKFGLSPAFTPEVSRRFSDEARRLCKLLETMAQPVIARVDGFCFTGALEIALACDLIIASDRSTFADTHAKIGLRPGWGGSKRLPARVGLMRAREMSFTARHYGAAEAARIGLILEAVPAEQLDARIEALCGEMLANKAYSIAQYKTLYRAQENLGLDDALAFEASVVFPGRRKPETPETSDG